jgi:hypothetical protein
MHKVTDLGLARSELLDASSLGAITKMPVVRSLNISGCKGVELQDLSLLHRMVKLEELNTTVCAEPDRYMLMAIAGIPNLIRAKVGAGPWHNIEELSQRQERISLMMWNNAI